MRRIFRLEKTLLQKQIVIFFKKTIFDHIIKVRMGRFAGI